MGKRRAMRCNKRNKSKVRRICKIKGVSSTDCRRAMARLKKGCKR